MVSEFQPKTAEGLRALQTGDIRRAFDNLSEAVDDGVGDNLTLMGLALAARAIGRPDDSLAAIERVLTLEPGNLEALIIKADALAAQGNERRAAAFYLAAVKAAPPASQLNGQLRAEIDRAREQCTIASIRYEEFLRERVNKLGLFDGSGRARGEQMLDILFGRKQIYLQQPEKFYFPELPQIQFYDPSDFDWTDDVVAATDEIREELSKARQEGAKFVPYVPKDMKTPQFQRHVAMGNENWGALFLFKDGVRVEENIKLCPVTCNVLSNVPMPDVPARSPIAFFSRLKPGMQIPPHYGMMNTRLVCHLPLIMPEGCAIRVGNQERTWRIGEMLIFDDSIDHEVRNRATSERIVLLFDIWRPELSEDERKFISTVCGAIEEYGEF